AHTCKRSRWPFTPDSPSDHVTCGHYPCFTATVGASPGPSPPQPPPTSPSPRCVPAQSGNRSRPTTSPTLAPHPPYSPTSQTIRPRPPPRSQSTPKPAGHHPHPPSLHV